jgi:acetyltransferase-like isoleucine patch superfamily enzyme
MGKFCLIADDVKLKGVTVGDYVKIYSNTEIGSGSIIGDHVEIGVPPRGRKPGHLRTVIGPDSNIRSKTIIYAGNRAGRNFQTGHLVMIREGNEIGDNVSVGTQTNIENDNKIGNGVRFHSQVFVPQFAEIKDHAWLGPKVCLANDPFPPNAKDMKAATIGKNAKIGMMSVLGPHITIGDNALVGMGAVVTKDVPAGKVAVGIPAKVIKDVDDLRYPDGKKAYDRVK